MKTYTPTYYSMVYDAIYNIFKTDADLDMEFLLFNRDAFKEEFFENHMDEIVDVCASKYDAEEYLCHNVSNAIDILKALGLLSSSILELLQNDPETADRIIRESLAEDIYDGVVERVIREITAEG